MLSSVIDALKDFANNYSSLITLVVTAIGGVATVFFGGKLFHSLVQHRIRHLEGELDENRAALSQRDQELNAARIELAEVTLKAKALTDKMQRISGAFEGKHNNIWLRNSPQPRPDDYDEKVQKGIPIILVANLKGGVGKTTLSANLAAYFETVHNERVLAIDLDYQGSLSSMLLPEPYNRQRRTADGLKKILSGKEDVSLVFSDSRPIRGSGRDSRIIDCDDPFADFETRMLVRWLVSEDALDVRYNLARTLCDDQIQHHFQRVIIDAPPRLTTGFVNALCSSTHLVVPFVLDILSAERVGLFLDTVKQMKPKLFPYLELGAVVGMMKGDKSPILRETEMKAVAEAISRVKQNWGPGDYVLEKLLVPRKQPIADAAGVSIAYFGSKEVRDIIDPLGREIFNRTRRERPHHEDTHPPTGAPNLRARTETFGVERVE
jgi:chromosome partitioning protein